MSGNAVFLGAHSSQLKHLGPALDIVKWLGYPCYVIFTGQEKLDHPEPIRYLAPTVRNNQQSGFNFLESIRWANELGLKRIKFSNCDDWVFSKQFTDTNFNRPEQLTGYSWFTVGSMDDLAINENYLDVATFAPHIDKGIELFKRRGSVEHNFARWVKAVKPTFYRLPDRERPWGIGTRFGDEIPDNKRFFCRKWQLIGYHDMKDKQEAYLSLCPDFPPDIAELEAMPRFAQWLEECCQLFS